ncbi:hypothetical protein [Schlesneria sp. T3-172]|uniref:hypothetical protein n=1 Tax=Schlesneria sphaerica TaxID=3373610 RepID=UPI0037C802E8
MKPPAILRKNMLFVRSEQGGHRAATLLSLVGSAKYCEVEPWHWLRAALEAPPNDYALEQPHPTGQTSSPITG